VNDTPDTPEGRSGPSRIYTFAAAGLAAIGLADSAYLTAKHYSGGEVPCSIISGCEAVLTSVYAEFYGIPTAAFGAAAYFAAFSLVLLTIYGNEKLWPLLGALTVVMFAVTVWLVYLQAFVIGSFCQFCILSAITTTLLFITYLASRFLSKR